MTEEVAPEWASMVQRACSAALLTMTASDVAAFGPQVVYGAIGMLYPQAVKSPAAGDLFEVVCTLALAIARLGEAEGKPARQVVDELVTFARTEVR